MSLFWIGWFVTGLGVALWWVIGEFVEDGEDYCFKDIFPTLLIIILGYVVPILMMIVFLSDFNPVLIKGRKKDG